MTDRADALARREEQQETTRLARVDQVIAKLDIARRALALAVTVPDAKQVSDVAAAAEIYARRQQLGEEAIGYAYRLKIEAMARLGELLEAMPKATGTRGQLVGRGVIGGTQGEPPIEPTQTYADLGLSKKAAAVAQQLAALPEDVREAIAAQETTLTKARRAAETARRQAEREAMPRSVERARVHAQDALVLLGNLKPASIDLLLTDPPYMTEIGADAIGAFAASWIPLALSRVKPTGRAYVFIGAYWPELIAYGNACALPGHAMHLVEHPPVWTYRNTLGPLPRLDYKRNWQMILYLRGPEAPPLDCLEMVEQFSVQDFNAPDGRFGERWHTWEKPSDLAERLIHHATVEGATVADPFAGTGTFVITAARLGRVGIGSEIDPAMLRLCRQRGAQVCP